MSLTANREQIVTLGHTIVFTVPDRVAEENGLFEKQGLDVVPSGGWTTSMNFVRVIPSTIPWGPSNTSSSTLGTCASGERSIGWRKGILDLHDRLPSTGGRGPGDSQLRPGASGTA